MVPFWLKCVSRCQDSRSHQTQPQKHWSISSSLSKSHWKQMHSPVAPDNNHHYSSIATPSPPSAVIGDQPRALSLVSPHEALPPNQQIAQQQSQARLQRQVSNADIEPDCSPCFPFVNAQGADNGQPLTVRRRDDAERSFFTMLQRQICNPFRRMVDCGKSSNKKLSSWQMCGAVIQVLPDRFPYHPTPKVDGGDGMTSNCGRFGTLVLCAFFIMYVVTTSQQFANDNFPVVQTYVNITQPNFSIEAPVAFALNPGSNAFSFWDPSIVRYRVRQSLKQAGIPDQDTDLWLRPCPSDSAFNHGRWKDSPVLCIFPANSAPEQKWDPSVTVLKGQFSDRQFSYVKLEMWPCSNSTTAPGSPSLSVRDPSTLVTCQSPDVITSFLQSLSVDVLVPVFSPDGTSMSSSYFVFDGMSIPLQASTVYLRHTFCTSTYSQFVEIVHRECDFDEVVSSSTRLISRTGTTAKNADMLFSVTLAIAPHVQVHHRKSDTWVDLLARLGGMWSLLSVGFGFVFTGINAGWFDHLYEWHFDWGKQALDLKKIDKNREYVTENRATIIHNRRTLNQVVKLLQSKGYTKEHEIPILTEVQQIIPPPDERKDAIPDEEEEQTPRAGIPVQLSQIRRDGRSIVDSADIPGYVDSPPTSFK